MSEIHVDHVDDEPLPEWACKKCWGYGITGGYMRLPDGREGFVDEQCPDCSGSGFDPAFAWDADTQAPAPSAGAEPREE